jgi:hypothetical protein
MMASRIKNHFGAFIGSKTIYTRLTMQKIHLVLFVLAFVFTACAGSKTAYYGDKIDSKGTVKASQVPDLMADKDSLALKVEGTIKECCAKKGCWLRVDLANGEEMLVRFKDYGFFVPLDSEGRKIIMDGVVKKEEISVATLRHYAEDAGKSQEEIEKITEPQTKFTFLAHGVILK